MPQAQTYTLPIGALAALKQLLPTASWYADEQNQQAKLIVHSVAAEEAIGDIPNPPAREDGEPEQHFIARLRTFVMTPRDVQWTDAQKNAVKVCVKYYLKKGAFTASPTTAKLLQVLDLADEE